MHGLCDRTGSGQFLATRQKPSPLWQTRCVVQCRRVVTRNKTGNSDIYRDGREWTRQVHEDPCGVVEAINIGALLASSGYRRISLLKMDVEGSDVVIFWQTPAWLSQVDNIAIELHDDSSFGSATNAFYSAIENEGFQISYSGELTICQRPS
jgi:FkbM family methyltransferase